MSTQLSQIGIYHTIIGILAAIAAIILLFQEGVINHRNILGKTYVGLTVISCLTSFCIMKTGHYTAAHAISILVLLLLALGVYARYIFGRNCERAEIICMSLTLFLSFISAVNHVLTTLPLSQPVAGNDNAPIVIISYGILTIFFVIVMVFQLRRLRAN